MTRYRLFRRYMRVHHPVIFGLDWACRVGLAAVAVWRLSGHRTALTDVLFLVFLVGTSSTFVLMVRRDPEGRL